MNRISLMSLRMRKILPHTFFLFLLISIAIPSGLLQAGDNNGLPGKIDPDGVEGLKNRIDTVGIRLAAAKKAENGTAAYQTGIPAEKLAERTKKLEAIQAVLERLMTAMLKRQSQIEEESILKGNGVQPQEIDIR